MKKYTRIANILFIAALIGFGVFEIYYIPRDPKIAAIASLSFLLTCIGVWLMGYYFEKIKNG